MTRPDVMPQATQHIPEMAALIARLLDNGHAYRTDDGSIFFGISSWPAYGALARLQPDQLHQGERVAADDYAKDDVRDFALWKGPRPGEPSWATEIGEGRPGWHIECSAMSMKYLGQSFDIHTGGVDLIFPHHENEIAQSEAATGQRFVNTWLHCAHLQLGGQKMARREGNIYRPDELYEQGWRPAELRYALLATYYRAPLEWTDDTLPNARAAVERLTTAVTRATDYDGPGAGDDGALDNAISVAVDGFRAGLDDDLNVSAALAAIFDLVRDLNRRLDVTLHLDRRRPARRRRAARLRPRAGGSRRRASRAAGGRSGPARRARRGARQQGLVNLGPAARGAGHAWRRRRGHPRRSALAPRRRSRTCLIVDRDATVAAETGRAMIAGSGHIAGPATVRPAIDRPATVRAAIGRPTTRAHRTESVAVRRRFRAITIARGRDHRPVASQRVGGPISAPMALRREHTRAADPIVRHGRVADRRHLWPTAGTLWPTARGSLATAGTYGRPPADRGRPPADRDRSPAHMAARPRIAAGRRDQCGPLPARAFPPAHAYRPPPRPAIDHSDLVGAEEELVAGRHPVEEAFAARRAGGSAAGRARAPGRAR